MPRVRVNPPQERYRPVACQVAGCQVHAEKDSPWGQFCSKHRREQDECAGCGKRYKTPLALAHHLSCHCWPIAVGYPRTCTVKGCKEAQWVVARPGPQTMPCCSHVEAEQWNRTREHTTVTCATCDRTFCVDTEAADEFPDRQWYCSTACMRVGRDA